MSAKEFKAEHLQKQHFFDPAEYGRIYAFVDFANVRQWAKSFWPQENRGYITREIDIAKLSAVIDCVKPEKKFFYYGHHRAHSDLPADHPYNVKHRKSLHRIIKAREHGFRDRTKQIKEINHFDDNGQFLGKMNKCNFDVEIAMDIVNNLDKYDTVFLWSGDADFHSLLQYLQSKKKKIITVCDSNAVSWQLHKHSNLFIPADPLKGELEYIKESPPDHSGGHKYGLIIR